MMIFCWIMLGILPFWWILIVGILAIYVKCKKIVKKSPIEELCSRGKYYKSEGMYFWTDPLYEICIFLSTTLILFPIVISFERLFVSYIYEMLQKIEVVSSIVLGLTTITITMALVIVIFDKRYYIVFCVQDVLQKYKFAEFLSVVIFSCILVSGMTLTLLNGRIDSVFDVVRFTILVMAALYNIVGVAYLLGVMVNIMFLERKSELSLLEQLYRFFLLHRVDKIHFKDKSNWGKGAVEINVGYLVEKYVDLCKRDEIVQIDKIEFSATLGNDDHKWYSEGRRFFSLTMLVLFAISTLLNGFLFYEKSYWFLLFNTIATAIMIILTHLKIDSIRFVIMRLYSDTWGYYFYLKTKNEMLIPRGGSRKNKVYG